ncbi:sodium-dependent transporter [Clostridiaceae bacterium M8S5]|nr:sodium-dependent transporter [Clostridiaceae bacterium M8S5]
MKSITDKKRDQFNSKLGFILAAAGSAVGLGNLWRFPYVTGNNGGGAFVFLYLVCIIVIGASLVIAEFAIGRNGRANAIESYGKLCKKFKAVGYLAMIAAIVLFSFYAIIGGWTIYYVIQAVSGKLIGLAPDKLGAMFETFLSNPFQMVIYQIVFLLLTAIVVSKGISKGIEKYCNVLMPLLFVMLIVLAIRSITLPGAMEGIIWYLKPDFSKIDGSIVASALGQAFFSLSIGSGCMVTYASYLSKEENIPRTAMAVTLADTGVALLAGFVIIPAVFAFNMEVGSGSGLAFVTLPQVFSNMPMGTLFAIVFFGLLVVAALTSSIGMLEVAAAFTVEKTKTSRAKATWLTTLFVFVLGIPPLMSFGAWSNVKIGGKNLFDMYDFFVSNISFPLVGFFGAILVGHLWRKEDVYNQVTGDRIHSFSLINIWYFFIKYLIPFIILMIFLQSIGILKI